MMDTETATPIRLKAKYRRGRSYKGIGIKPRTNGSKAKHKKPRTPINMRSMVMHVGPTGKRTFKEVQA